MAASGAEWKWAKVKVTILLHARGEDALEVYNTLHIIQVNEAELTVDDILMAFRTDYQPKKSSVWETSVLGTSYGRLSHQWEVHDRTEAKKKSKDCELGASENNTIRDKIVFSLKGC